MRKRLRTYLPIVIPVVFIVLNITAVVVLGHDCASQEDCEETAGYNGTIAIIGGIIAIIAGILGTSLGGPATMPATQDASETMPRPGGPTTATQAPPTTATTTPSRPVRGSDLPTPTDRTEPLVVPGGDPGGPSLEEIGELFGPEPAASGPATEPTTGGPTESPTEPTTRPGGRVRTPPSTTPVTGPTVEEIQKLFGPEEPADTPDGTKPLDTSKPSDEPATMPGEAPTAPADTTDEPTPPRTWKPAKVDEGKALGQDTLEKISDFSGQVKDGIDWTGKQIDKLGITDKSKEELKEGLEKVGGPAEHIKDAADKANEYVQVLDENLQKTDKMKIPEQSRDFLGWWRVTFKAAGELTQKFVDKLASPVTGLIKKVTGKDGEEMLHQAVPIKEFGDELSKLPTSAAQNVVNAQNRDQIQEAQQAWHGKEPDPDDLSDIYPRDWTKVK